MLPVCAGSFFQDVVNMEFNRADRYKQFLGDIFIVEILKQHFHYFCFAIRNGIFLIESFGEIIFVSGFICCIDSVVDSEEDQDRQAIEDSRDRGLIHIGIL